MATEISCIACRHRWSAVETEAARCPRCGEAVASEPAPHAITTEPAALAASSQSIQAGWPPPDVALADLERRLTRGIVRPPQGQKLAAAAGVLLLLSAGADAVQMLAELQKAAALYNLLHGGVFFDPFPFFFLFANGMGLAGVVLFLITASVIMTWLYTAYDNLSVLQVTGLSWTPGQALRKCLWPLSWAYMPYRIVQEIWRASEPALPADSDAWKKQPGSRLILLWWLLFVCRHVRVNIAIHPFPVQDQAIVTTIMVASCVNALACLLGIVAGLLFFYLLLRLQRRQWERFEFLQEIR